MKKENLQNILKNLPKVDKLLEHEKTREILKKVDKPLVLLMIHDILNSARRELKRSFQKGHGIEKVYTIDDFADELVKKVNDLLSDNQVQVVNATGTILHTNLGRAPIAKDDLRKGAKVSSYYSNLEFNLKDGKRGYRYDHFQEIIKLITGAEDALAVNNNAAAVLLVLNTFCEGKEAIVSRGELIEIGGAFRIPEIMSKSQAVLREVGTTNKTHLKDYKNAIAKDTGILLKVHTSNYKIVGFTKEVSLEELVSLGKEHRIPVFNDLGSGCLVDLSRFGIAKEMTVQEAIKAGAGIVTFSGDKLLGGPQAGIIAGKKRYIDEIKKNPLTRALRLDKMTVSILEQTFRKYLNTKNVVKSIPTLNMLTEKKERVKKRCERLLDKLTGLKKKSLSISMKPDHCFIGGGALPLEEIDTYVIILKSKVLSCSNIAKLLRIYKVPVIVRVCKDHVILDMRTILQSDEKIITDAVKEIFE